MELGLCSGVLWNGSVLYVFSEFHTTSRCRPTTLTFLPVLGRPLGVHEWNVPLIKITARFQMVKTHQTPRHTRAYEELSIPS